MNDVEYTLSLLWLFAALATFLWLALGFSFQSAMLLGMWSGFFPGTLGYVAANRFSTWRR